MKLLANAPLIIEQSIKKTFIQHLFEWNADDADLTDLRGQICQIKNHFKS